MQKTIITHPNNRVWLERGLRPAGDTRALDDLIGLPIRFNEHVPERDIEERYHLPAGDRFVEYEESDRAWMEKLCRWTGDRRYGHIETVDLGPAFWVMDMPGIQDVLFGSEPKTIQQFMPPRSAGVFKYGW